MKHPNERSQAVDQAVNERFIIPRNADVRFDYELQAWIVDGRYTSCAHPAEMRCSCYGRAHAGELATFHVECRACRNSYDQQNGRRPEVCGACASARIEVRP